jgi:hypothetical protein
MLACWCRSLYHRNHNAEVAAANREWELEKQKLRKAAGGKA